MSEENILARVGGEYVAAALQTLPNPETTQDEIQETVIEVPGCGMVRFTCRRMVGRHRKHQWRF